MYRVVPYSDIERNRWNVYAVKNGSLFHMIEWKELLEEVFGYKGYYYLAVNEDNEVAGLLPIITGRNLTLKKVGVSTPFINHLDICCTDPAVVELFAGHMQEICQKHALDYIELRLKDQNLTGNNTIDRQQDGNSQKAGSYSASLDDRSFTFILPLDGGEEQVMALSTSDNKNHIRKHDKNNWFSASFDKAKLKDFYKAYRVRQHQLGSPAPGIKFFKKIIEKFPGNYEILTVIDNETKKTVNGMFLLTWKDTVFYPYGGGYNKKYCNEFMYWESVKYGIQKGFKFLDMGRSEIDSGTYNFKKKWGAKPIQLKYYKFSSNNAEVKGIKADDVSFFVNMWKVTPSVITNAVGKILIKYVLP